MKLKLRFISFFTLALFGFLCYISALMALLLEFVLPLFHAEDNTAAVLILFLFSFLSAAVLFSHIFVKPLLIILSTLKELSENHYDLTALDDKLFRKNGKLKRCFFLFKEAITELKELASQLEQAKKERVQLEQAKRDWVRGISHDLKTPLSYILGYSALLSNPDYIWETEEQQKFISEIYSKSQYLEDLIGDLRLSFEIEDPKSGIPLSCTDFDLIPFLQDLIADVANNPKALNNNFSFETDIPALTIHADQRLLYRTFQNLLINAVLHNPAKTEISLNVFAPQEHQVKILVTDNGCGIDENSQKIFSEESSYPKGWNGLAIVKNIILAHGGKISLKTNPELGNTFTIFLPLS